MTAPVPVPASFSAVTTLAVSANITNPLDIGSASANLSNTFGTALTIGALAGQANAGWWDYRTLAASTSEQLNLVATLLNGFGVAVTFARVKMLLVSALAANTNNVVVGGGSNAISTLFGATTHTTIIRPGATVCWIAGATDATGYVVTPATANLLQIGNSGAGTPVSYSINIFGTTT